MRTFLLFAFLTLPFTSPAQQKSYIIAFLNIKPDKEKLDPAASAKLQEAHMANIQRLAKEGKLLAAGPFDGGGGLFIFNTASTDDAQEWISTDPAVQANRWNIELLPYTPRIGSVCPVSEPYEMVTYTLVRFNAVVQKYTAKNYPIIILQHEAYVKKVTRPSDIVTEAIFGPNEGGILILRGEVPADAFSDDPGVQQQLLDVQIKKLYIARTSFCEN